MKLRLKDRKLDEPGVESFYWEQEQPVTWEPGQYAHYILPHSGVDGRGDGRWFTISNAPFEKDFRITTRFDGEKVSSFKKELQKLKVGDEIEYDDGPKGFFTVDDPSKHSIFIAGGIGITPYRAILEELDHDGKKINADLFYTNRDENIVFKDELEQIASRQPNFKIHYFIGDKRIEETNFKQVDPNLSLTYYISGPRPMVEAYETKLKNLGVVEKQIKLDYFPGY